MDEDRIRRFLETSISSIGESQDENEDHNNVGLVDDSTPVVLLEDVPAVNVDLDVSSETNRTSPVIEVSGIEQLSSVLGLGILKLPAHLQDLSSSVPDVGLNQTDFENPVPSCSKDVSFGHRPSNPKVLESIQKQRKRVGLPYKNPVPPRPMFDEDFSFEEADDTDIEKDLFSVY